MKAVLLLACSVCAWAQSLSTTGQVQGVVVDSTGAGIAGVRVTLVNKGTGAARTVETGEAGRFVMAGAPIGEYRLRAEAAGFAAVEVDEFLVSVGRTVFQRLELKPAVVVEKLEVIEQAEALQTAATTTNAALGYDRIEESPAQGRNYLNFVFVAPGVAPSSGANTGRSAAATRNAANDSGFVFAGIRGRNNSISIDGVDNRDETTGGNRVAIGLEMVQEFRVAATSVAPEYGGAAGGIVNVVTRSGTNLWHGDATMFFQNELLNARNPEAQTSGRPIFRRYQPGVSVNGPVRKDRTFFATAVETAWESQEEWSDTSPALAGAIEKLLAKPEFAGAGLRQLTKGLFPVKSRDTEFSFKFHHILSQRHSFTARYALSNGRVEGDVQGVDNFADWSARGSSRVRDHSLVAGLISVLSSTTVNDVRAQVARRTAKLTPNAGGPQYEVPGALTFGQAYRLNQDRTEDHYEVVEGFHVTRGAHTFTLGASAHRVNLDARLANRFGGIYVFPTLADLQAGRPDVFLQAFGEPSIAMHTTPVGAWFQDRWQAHHGLTIEAGLRYDRQWMPAGIPASNRNFSPRLGLAWRPADTSKWVLRAGSGLFFDRYPLAFLNESVQKDGVRGFEQYGTGPAAARIFSLLGGGAAAEPVIGIARSAYRAADKFPSMYAAKVTAGLERALGPDTTVSLEYTHVHGLHLPRLRNAAAILPPQYALEQASRSDYQGATLTVHRRLSKEFTYLLTYTAGRTRDDASDFDEQPTDPGEARRDWALSRQHQLHRVAASCLFEAFERLHISPSFTFGSGRPLNALDSTDSARNGAYPISARPFGLGRNPHYSPETAALDLRVFKTVPVREGRAHWVIGVEAFNLLNHTKPLRVSPYYAAGRELLPSYRGILEVSNARQVQLLLSLEY